MSAYPPVAFPPPPPTSNTLSSQQRSALVRSSHKLSKVLGDVPRVPDDMPLLPFPSSLELASPNPRDNESIWRKRKPTHLPPLLKPSTPSIDAPDSPTSLTNDLLSMVSRSSTSDAPVDAAQRRAKLERLRRKLGHEVPATAVFPTPPRTAVPAVLPPPTPKTSHARTRTRSHSRSRSHSVARPPVQVDDARSIAFTVSSEESVHTVTFTAARVHSPRPHKTKAVYHTGPLPPIPPIPAHLVSAGRAGEGEGEGDDDDAGLIRPRLKMPAGSRIGGSDFKAARRAKREGRSRQGTTTELGETVEMVGFMF